MNEDEAIAFAKALIGEERTEAIAICRSNAEADPGLATSAALNSLVALLISKGVITLDEIVATSKATKASMVDDLIRKAFGEQS